MDWKFYEFVHGVVSDRGIIEEDMEPAPKAELYIILTEDLGIKTADEWGLPSYRPLDNGLGEIRFNVKNVQYRVFGSFAPNRCYRLWQVATKARKRKGKQATDPPNAIDQARKRKKDYELHHMGKIRILWADEKN